MEHSRRLNRVHAGRQNVEPLGRNGNELCSSTPPPAKAHRIRPHCVAGGETPGRARANEFRGPHQVPANYLREVQLRGVRTAADKSVDMVDRGGGHPDQDGAGRRPGQRLVTIVDDAGAAQFGEIRGLHEWWPHGWSLLPTEARRAGQGRNRRPAKLER